MLDIHYEWFHFFLVEEIKLGFYDCGQFSNGAQDTIIFGCKLDLIDKLLIFLTIFSVVLFTYIFIKFLNGSPESRS